MNKIDISVVVPVYNSERTIIESLSSIVENFESTRYTWELLIINDGSSDDSLELIREYAYNSTHKSNIQIISQKNSGAAAARNTGIKLSKGEFIAFNDSDDKWLPQKISLQMTFMNNNKDVDMLGCKYGNDSFQKGSLFKLTKISKITIKHQILKNYFSPPTVIFRKSALKKTGLFNQKMRYAEEGYFFNKMVYFHNCVLMDHIVAENINTKYRWGDSGLSGNLKGMEKGELFNIRYAYSSKFIGLGLFVFATCFSIGKYFRRILLKNFRSK